MSKYRFYAEWESAHRTLDGEKVYRGFWLSPDPVGVLGDGRWYREEYLRPEVRVVEFRLTDLAREAISAMQYSDDSHTGASARAKAALDTWGHAVGCEPTHGGGQEVDIQWLGSRPGPEGYDLGWYACKFGEFRPRTEMLKFVASVQRDAVGDDYDPTPTSVVTKLLAKGYIPLRWIRSEYRSGRLNRTCWDNVLIPHKGFEGASSLWKTHAEYAAHVAAKETAAATA